jgi:electron transfer flavoprotein alpha subunit
MNVLVYIDVADSHVKKASLEAANYASAVAKKTGGASYAIALGTIANDQLTALGSYGVSKVFYDGNEAFNSFDSGIVTKAIAQCAQENNVSIVVFSHNQNGKAVAPRVAVRLQAGMVPGANELPDTSNGFTVRKGVFSGKAMAHINITTANKVISVSPNSYNLNKVDGLAELATFTAADTTKKVTVSAVNKIEGEVPLTEAELVVSGGRGLKGPENWALVTDLAKLIGAATACSRAVADAHWRPHHEHVGQTGYAIAPNLYFAIGISGAIQHLAGVNRSKTIVVINKDPEAPFFKAADYGIVGDAFEVMPKIIEAVRQLKG